MWIRSPYERSRTTLSLLEPILNAQLFCCCILARQSNYSCPNILASRAKPVSNLQFSWVPLHPLLVSSLFLSHGSEEDINSPIHDQAGIQDRQSPIWQKDENNPLMNVFGTNSQCSIWIPKPNKFFFLKIFKIPRKQDSFCDKLKVKLIKV